MKSFLLLISLVGSLLITACDSSPVDGPKPPLSTDDPQVKKAFLDSSIECPSNDCPSFVGGLYSLRNNQLKACSVTLISPHQVLTQKFCLPGGVRDKGVLCQGLVRVILPATQGLPAEQLQCDQVLEVAERNDTDGSSWIIIQLASPSARTPVSINHAGVAEHSSVTAYTTNFDLKEKSPSQGVVKATTCQANTNHLLSNRFIGPQSFHASMSHCSNKLSQGHVGAGVLNEQKELIAMLIDHIPLDSESEISNEIAQLKEDYPGLSKQNVGWATNLACIPVGDHKPGEDCEVSPVSYQDLSPIYLKLMGQRQHSSFNEELEALSLSSLNLSQEWVKMSLVDEELFNNFQFEFPQRIRSLRTRAAHLWLSNTFAALPQCVHRQAPNEFSFEFEALSRVSRDQVVDDHFKVTYPSRRAQVLAQATKVIGEDSYRLRFGGPYGQGSSLFTLLGGKSPGTIDYFIPMCLE